MAEQAAVLRAGAQLKGADEVLAALANLAAGGQRMRPLMRRIGERIVEPSIRETLRREGRGTWPPEQRPVRRHRWLGEQGKIGRTLRTEAGDRRVTVGTTSRFGLWAQFGFRAAVRTAVPRRKRVLRLFAGGRVRFAKRARAHRLQVPPRVLFALWPEDELAITAEVRTYLDRLARRKAKAGVSA